MNKKLYIDKLELIWSMAKNDFKMKYIGSKMGIGWGFINPLITIVLYWFVFEVGLRSSRADNGLPFILWLLPGIIPWFFISEAIVVTSNCFHEYSFLVKKVLFPLHLLPVIKIISCFFVHIVFLDVLFIIYAIYGYELKMIYLQIIYYIICEFVLIYNISVIVSALSVFVKDIIQIINILIQIFFWTLPIVWTPEHFSDRIIKILKINPFYYIIDGFRDCFINDIYFYEKIYYTLYFWFIMFILFFVGNFIREKLSPYFSDIL